jgi:hypothetical protein
MTLRLVGQILKEPHLILAWAILLMAGFTSELSADQVETQNGDRYIGKVLSVNAETLVFQNEVLGTVKLPRAKISHITLGTNSPINGAFFVATNGGNHTPAFSGTNSSSELSATARQLGSNSNLIQQVQAQFLNGAGPEAKEKFDQLLGGFMSGKLSVDDIRAQAKSAADQLRSAKNELGGDSGFMIDSYLAILDNFLKETAPTNTAVSKPSAAATGQ